MAVSINSRQIPVDPHLCRKWPVPINSRLAPVDCPPPIKWLSTTSLRRRPPSQPLTVHPSTSHPPSRLIIDHLRRHPSFPHTHPSITSMRIPSVGVSHPRAVLPHSLRAHHSSTLPSSRSIHIRTDFSPSRIRVRTPSIVDIRRLQCSILVHTFAILSDPM
ncbi:hypothetical protein EDD18DRAFT_1228650, partial [Armillaria luteobubalina]